MSQQAALRFFDEEEIETWPLQLNAELEAIQKEWLLRLIKFLSSVYPKVRLTWEGLCFTGLRFSNESTNQPVLLQTSAFISAKTVDEDGALTATTRVLLCPKQWSMPESNWGNILTGVQVLLLNMRKRLYGLNNETTLVMAHLKPAWDFVVGTFENKLGFEHIHARYVVDVRFLPKLQYSLWPQELLKFLAVWPGCEAVIRTEILTKPKEREDLGEPSDDILQEVAQWCQDVPHVKPPTDISAKPILRNIQAKIHCWKGKGELLRKFEGTFGKINQLLCIAVNESKERRNAVIAALSRFGSDDDAPAEGWLTEEYPEWIPGALYQATHAHILDEKLVRKAKQMLREKMSAEQQKEIDWLLQQYDSICAGARICPKCNKLIRVQSRPKIPK